MYEELIKDLRDSAEWADRLAILMGRIDGDVHAPIMRKAADAIEELDMKLRGRWESDKKCIPMKYSGGKYCGNCGAKMK